MGSPALQATPSSLVLDERSSTSTRALAIADVAAIALLTPLILLVHGYHPYADDAGIYVAGIRKMLDPTLFQLDAGFVTAHTHFSVFSHLFAESIRLFDLPLPFALFASYLLSIFLFLLACFRLSRRIFADQQLQWGATLLAGSLFTLPVAATALWLMDPYVTARSFSTPASALALAACVDRSWKRTILWLLATTALHPLMAIYLAGFLAAYSLADRNQWRWLAITSAGVFCSAGVAYLMTRNAPLPYGYREAVLTRTYFFLSFWHWYELLGLAIPLLLMGIAARFTRNRVVRTLCLSAIASGVTATAIAACFVHTSGGFFLARLQPLRAFHMIYLVGVLLLGGLLAQYFRGPRVVAGLALLLAICGLMLFVQRQAYDTSAHIEWPYSTPVNPWQQAFFWIRENTPKNAVFALDSNYTQIDSEDTQGFRATAERSALVDELKDGGVVAIFPQLAPRWKTQRDLELGLDRISDRERVARLRPAGVSWVLLSAGAVTQLDCPYRNTAVSVCRLP